MKISIEEKINYSQPVSPQLPARFRPFAGSCSPRLRFVVRPGLIALARTTQRLCLHNGILLGATPTQELAIINWRIFWLMYQVLCGVGLEYVIMQNSPCAYPLLLT